MCLGGTGCKACGIIRGFRNTCPCDFFCEKVILEGTMGCKSTIGILRGSEFILRGTR